METMKHPFVSVPPPILWLTFQDAACCDWAVYVGDEEQIPQLEGSFGVTLHEIHLIGISSKIPFDLQCLTLFHEIHHAGLSGVGDPKTLSKVLDCEAGEVEEYEEAIVSFVSPKIFSILIRAGFLRFPKIPKSGRVGRG